MGILFSVCAFLFTLLRTRQGVAKGLESLLAVGYAYGIVRANFPDGRSHFAFDFALLGLYLAHFSQRPSARGVAQGRPAVFWLKVLAVLPALYFLVPVQHPLIQLVGLRAAVLFLPLIVIGARLELEDLGRLARSLAVLNVAAVAFAFAELLLGVEVFYPRNQVTELIYRSTDVGVDQAMRIPATFTSSHAFAGTLVGTLPILLGSWSHLAKGRRERTLLFAAIGVTALGIFLSGARLPVIILVVLVSIAFLSGRLLARRKIALAVGGVAVALLISTTERFQRFLTLRDTAFVEERVASSVNLGFFEVVWDYPLGVGLGRAAGTSIPFFLADLADPQIGMENEYSRLALEQGIIGLAVWAVFILWTLTRSVSWAPPSWSLGARMIQVTVAVIWVTSMIGTGTLTSIPGTSLLLLYMGLLSSGQAREAPEAARPQRFLVASPR